MAAESTETTRANVMRTPRWLLIASVAAAIIAVIYFTEFYAPQRRAAAVAMWEARVEGYAGSRRQVIDRLVQDYVADAQSLAHFPSIRYLAAHETGPPYPFPIEEGATLHVTKLLRSGARAHGYDGAWVFDADARQLVTAHLSDYTRHDAGARKLAARVMTSGLPGTRYAQSNADCPHAYFAAPITDQRSAPASGAVVISVDACSAIMSLLPTSTLGRSAEAMIVVREDESVHVVGASRTKVRDLGALAARAFTENEQSGEYVDGSGTHIIAATRKVTGAPWVVVAMVDRDEALAAYRQEIFRASLMMLGLLLATLGASYALAIGLKAERALSEVRIREESTRVSEELRRNYELLNAITEGTTDAVFVKDLAGKYLFVNTAGAKALGYAPGQMIGRTDEELVPSAAKLFRSLDYEVVQSRAAIMKELCAEVRGTQRAFSTTCAPLMNTDGVITGVFGIARDVTEQQRIEEDRRRAHRELEEAQRRYDAVSARAAALLDAKVVGIAITREDGSVVEANDYYLEMTGYTRHELERGELRWIDITPPEYLASDLKAINEIKKGGSPKPYEKEYIKKTGERFWVLMGRTLLSSETGEILTFAVDITSHKALELQYQHAQKMEAIGRLAGGVAHDFNNILTAIKGITCMAIDELPPNDVHRADLLEIDECADRATALTRQLLAFSRRQVLQPRPFDMRDLLERADRMLRRLIGEDIEMRVQTEARPLTLFADPTQIEQVILNLAVNARDAMPTGGILHITAQLVDESVTVSVTDTGIGMEPSIVARIFEPFFTTKEQGKGTGLGLATVYGIVEQSAGSITVDSQPGVGTTFTIRFPFVEAYGAAETDTEPTPSAPERPHRKSVVLLVEDEDSVRNLVKRAIERAGHSVLVAGNASEALILAERNQGRIDLVVTDLVMPGLSGRDLVARLRSSHRIRNVLFMSGYSADVVREEGALDGHFIEKPFTPAELCMAVNQALHANLQDA